MLERVLFLAVIVALAIGLAFSEFARHGDRKAARALEAEISASLAETRIEAQSALAAIIRPETIETADQSVYLVRVDGNPNGTAFVVDRARGILASAAHVVNGLPVDDPNRRVEIINQYTGAAIPVSAVRKHAGFGSFTKAVEAYQPVRRDTELSRPRVVAVEETPFDAGVIVVNPFDEAGENILGPDLPIASEETLRGMRAGDPIAIIGFPRDRVGGGQLGAKADSRAERGVVAAMIAPVDNIRSARDPAIANLIIHRMATASGNSGSPVLNAVGEVVGIHTHGVNGSDSNGDGLAQRADMLRDLLEPLREETRLAELFRPAWEERLEHWARAGAVLPWSFYESYVIEKDRPDDRRLVSDIDLTANAPFATQDGVVQFSENLQRFVAGASDLNAATGAAGALSARQSAFVIPEKGQYRETTFTVDPDKDTVLYGFDYAVNSANGYCPLTVFWRPVGADKLEVIRNRSTASIRLTAAENDAKRVHVIFKRPTNCDRASRDFLIGYVEWDPADTPAALTASHDRPAIVNAALEGVGNAGGALRQLVTCAVAKPGAIAACEEPEFIEATAVHAREVMRPAVNETATQTPASP